jgi:hypothetical protein
MYIETKSFGALRERNRSYELHSMRLLATKKTIDNDCPVTFGRRPSRSKVAEKLRAEEIKRGNEQLLTKLVDISADSKFRSASAKRFTPLTNLNSRSKKLEVERIQKENSFLSKRLKSLESSLNYSKFRSEHLCMEKYKRQISRVQRLSPKATLPPLFKA